MKLFIILIGLIPASFGYSSSLEECKKAVLKDLEGCLQEVKMHSASLGCRQSLNVLAATSREFNLKTVEEVISYLCESAKKNNPKLFEQQFNEVSGTLVRNK